MGRWLVNPSSSSRQTNWALIFIVLEQKWTDIAYKSGTADEKYTDGKTVQDVVPKPHLPTESMYLDLKQCFMALISNRTY